MKILHVINSLLIGGAETLIVDMAIEMNKQHNVTVLVLGDEDSFLMTRLQEENINIIKITKKINSLRNLMWLQKNLNKYDVVHSHLSWAQYFTSIAAITNRKCKVITTEHSTSNRRRKKILFKIIDRFMYAPYDKIVMISEGTKKSMIEWQPKFSEKFILIHNGINIKKFENAIPNREIKKRNKIKLLMVAAFRNEKDQDTVVRALQILDEKYEVYFVGDGERKYKVEKLTEELNLTSRVHFLGVRSDVAEIMKACDIFILSSHWEGFGLVAVEAMAAGLPVIATNVEGLRDIISNKELLFEVKNEKELKKIIKEKRLFNGDNVERYSLETCVKKHISIYSN